MFSWTDDVDDAHVTAASAALDGLPAAIPQIVAYRHGPDVGLSDDNFDYVVVADFATKDDFLIYRDAPVHTDLIQRYMTGRLDARAAVQYETET